MPMARVDYDDVAATFDARYARYDWRVLETFLRRFVHAGRSVVEVGCGTGHWLAAIADLVSPVIGIDPSAGMLQRARATAPAAFLVRASAEQLPLATESVDRVFCVNALHHFHDEHAFVRECRRVLRRGGGFVSLGLDPHSGLDTWWIYDYFPGALPADRARYGPAAGLRGALMQSGFLRVVTDAAQHISAEMPFEQAERSGLLDRKSASQFLVITEAEYASGIDRLRAEQPTLRSDLRIFATSGWVHLR